MITEAEFTSTSGRLKIRCQFPNGADLRCTRTGQGELIVSTNDQSVLNVSRIEKLLNMPDPQHWYQIASLMRNCQSVQEVLQIQKV